MDLLNKAKPYLLVIFMQFGYAGMAIISKFALNHGMSQHVLVVYRYSIATLVITPFALFFDRKIRPKMTFSTFFKILLLGLLEPTIDQNLYYTGMKYTTATFASAMCNILPAFAFLMACFSRLEKVNIRRIQSQAKILGTIITVGGAMLMTLLRGSKVNLPWTKDYNDPAHAAAGRFVKQDQIKGALMIVVGCVCWAGFVNLQALTLKSYPAVLSLTALICCTGAIQGSILAVVLEWNNPSVWSIQFDSKLLAVVYSGVISSGVAYYVQGLVMQTKGPVFVTSFGPLSLVITAVLSSFVLSEVLYMGRVIGAMVIVTGLYIVLWAKSKDYQLRQSNDQKLDNTVKPKQVDANTNQQKVVAIDLTTSKTPSSDEHV